MRFNNRMLYALAIAIMVGVLMFPATSYADGEPIRYKDDKSREEFDAQYNWNLMISSDTSDNSEFESERQFLTSSFLVEAASNQDYTEGDYVIELKENAVTIKRYIGEETGTLTVPREVQGYPVTEIDEKAFQYCNASSIVLPDTVTKIGTEAFYACRRITTFETPASVTSMGYWAFYCCNNLESVTIPASLITFNGNPFDGCNKLKTITIDSGNQKYSMYGHALIETENMLRVTYEYGHVGETLTIPDGIKTVGAEAFGYAGPNFKKLIIPDSVETISGSAFCFSNAVTIEIGAGVKQMDYGAFCYSHSLKSVVIAEGTTCIGGNAFSNCENLETITIPDSVTSIAQNAFDGDYKLSIIANPGSYASTYAEEHGINNRLQSGDFVYELNENGVIISRYTGDETETLTVPGTIGGNQVVEIDEKAFQYCNASSIILPDTVTKIGTEAFYACRRITTFETPASVTSMGYWAFYCCNNLESATIPASLITFNGNPFDGCNKLKTITIDSGNQKYSMYGHALIETENMLLVTYEYGHVGETLTIPDGIKTVGAEAFGYAGPNFKKLIIPDSVETISGSAFCFSNAVTIEIGAGVKQMDYGAFCYSHSLKSVVIAEGTTCIGGNAFSNCENLETITIPDSVTSIAQNAFDGDYKLHIIAKPRSYAASFATEQEINLQYSLEGMDVMYLPENTQLIQAQAFASTACEAVIVPESCVSIGTEAFSGCSRLVYIKVPQATEIAEDAFAGCSELLVVDRY